MSKRLPQQVSIYALTPAAPDEQRLLLLRRRPERYRIWQGVTGGVEEGETPQEAAQREFREETGREIRLPATPVWSYTFTLAPEFWPFFDRAKILTETVFYTILPRFVPRLSPEHDAWGWVDPVAALRIVHWPQNRQSIQRILRLIRQDCETGEET